jgi:hypothetical protein
MKITIENTTKIVEANGVQCRVWEGQTESGVKVTCLIPRIAVKEGQDITQFEAELKEERAPSADVQFFPMRMIL